MPKRLTAENGAKALLVGEFAEILQLSCETCDSDVNQDCPECGGCGALVIEIPISWTTIKAIYAKAVKHLQIKGE